MTWSHLVYHCLNEFAFDKAIVSFEKAITLAPNFAPAYAGLAESYLDLSFFGDLSASEAFPKATAAALQALKLDETLVGAYISLGYAFALGWEWETSESNFERAIVNNPSNAKAHYFYAQYCLIVGRFEEAIQEMRRALQLDPLSPLYNTQLGGVFLNAGRLDEAIAQLRLTLELFPDEALAHDYLGLAYLRKGMFAPGITEIQKRNSLMWWVDPDLSLELAYAFAVSGEHEEARRILNNVLKGSGQRTVSMSGIASVYTALGDKEAAIAWLQKAVNQHEGETLLIKTRPAWDSLRSDSRFQALLKKMDLD